MRLICPDCGAQYEVDDALIPEDGRDVQCSNCGAGWFQRPPALGSEYSDALGTNPELAALGYDDLEDEDEEEDGLLPPEDAPPPRPSSSSRLDASVRSILMEEAEREARARRGQPRIETQEELGLDPRERPAAARPEPSWTGTGIPGLSPQPKAAPARPAAPTSAPPAPSKPLQDAPKAGTPRPDDLMAEAMAASGAIPPLKKPESESGLGQAPAAPRPAEAPQPGPTPATPQAPEARPAAAPALAPGADLATEAGTQPAARPTAAIPAEAKAAPFVPPAPEARPAAPVPSRRDLLPDIEEIKSSLQPANERAPSEEAASPERARGGFGLGFMAVVVLALIGVLIYAFAAEIGKALPALEPGLTAYTQTVDALRIWLDERARALVLALKG